MEECAMTWNLENEDPRVDTNHEPSADLLDFLFKDAKMAGDLGQNLRAPAVLEVVQVWEDTVLEVRHLAPGDAAFTLGGDPESTFTAPDGDLPTESLALFSHSTDGFVVRVSDRWQGFVQDGEGARQALSAASGEAEAGGVCAVVVPEGSSVWIDTGHVLFAARHVPAGRRVAPVLRDRVDYPLLGIGGFVSFAALLLGVVIGTAAPPSETTAIEGVPERIAMVLMKPPPAPVVVDTPKPKASNEAEGEKAQKEEGRSGDRKSKMREAKGSRVAMNNARRDREIANSAGLLGALQDEGVTNMLGDGVVQSGMLDTIGSKYAGARGNRMGVNGLGDRGDGLGNGGRVAGIGGTGTRARGGGDGKYGENGGKWGKKGDGKLNSLSGEVITLGSLDKALVDAVVKRHAQSIRYCYQRELTKDPSLAGKVTVKFFIDRFGGVSKSSIKRSSLGSTAAESCIKKRFMTMQFPEPKGGGVVIVSYPFMFSAG
jgi:hypothetical protein